MKKLTNLITSIRCSNVRAFRVGLDKAIMMIDIAIDIDFQETGCLYPHHISNKNTSRILSTSSATQASVWLPLCITSLSDLPIDIKQKMTIIKKTLGSKMSAYIKHVTKHVLEHGGLKMSAYIKHFWRTPESSPEAKGDNSNTTWRIFFTMSAI